MSEDTNTDSNIESTDLHDDSHDDVVVVETKRTPTEYELRLRKEAQQAKARLKQKEIEHAADLAKIQASVDERFAAQEKATKDRLLMAELKAAATSKNIVDLDLLKLMDLSAAKFSKDGEVLNAGELVENFRASKPHLFSSETSTPVFMPKPKAPASAMDKLDFKNMSKAEVEAARRKMLGGY